MGVFYLQGIQNGATFLGQLADLSVGINSEQMAGYASGYPYPLFRATRGQTPSAPFGSGAVGSVLDWIYGISSDYFAADLSGNVTDILYRQGEDVGVRYGLATLNHERFRLNKGFLFWDTISVALQQDAQIACQLIAAYDGTNAPIVRTAGIAAGGTPAASEFYTLGPVSINGVALTELQDWSLSSGASLIQVGGAKVGESGIWPTFVGIDQLDPIFTCSVQGTPWGNLSSILGTSLTSDLVFYLRRKAADGSDVADNVASHIKLTATKGSVLPGDMSGAPVGSAVQVAIRAPDADTDFLTIDTASIIT